ncbi:condensation domain-containing protein, partial [Rhodococcus erythropolis]|nr:condensation domain-containing protein [Rhodococcus erythropolis]
YMVPTTVTVLDEFPLTANGKLDRRALPEPDLAELSAHVAARNEVEQQFCTLIASAVGLESVGVTDDFFALGGDSIVAISLVTAARAAGLSISPREVFQLRTAEAMARAQSGRTAEIVDHSDEPIGHVATTPIAARALGTPDVARTFHQRALIQTPSALTSEHVEAALDALVARHDGLRAKLTSEGSLLVPATNELAVVFETRALPVPLEECGPLIVAETERAVRRLNPADGTMVSAVLFTTATGPGRLLLVIHHAVVDGVSWRIILEDLARAGIAAIQGDEPSLAPVGTSVRRYAELVSEAVGAGRLDSEIEFWDSVTSAQQSPLGRRALDPTVDLARTAAARSITLPPEFADRLLGSVPRAFGADVSEVLITALAVALTKWSGASSVTIDLEGHGRDEDIVRGDGAAHVDLTRTVGWFTTVFPVALEIGTVAPDLEASGELAVVLKSVKEQLRRVPNAGFGYGALRYLGSSDQLRSVAAPE